MKNYSQNNEQQLILEYFGEHVGKFLDIGANDGITLSNSYALTQLGWSGVLLDASPQAFARLTRLHHENSKLFLYNCLLGDFDGETEFNESGELLGSGDVGLVSSSKPSELQRWKSLNMSYIPHKLMQQTFASFLKILPFTEFDFVTIDIEGCEIEVVPQINFRDLKTKMAIIEWNGTAGHFYDDYMNQFGMHLIHVNAENRIYAKL